MGGESPTWVKGQETQALLALQPRGFDEIPQALSTTLHILLPLPVISFRSQLCDLGPGGSPL